MIRIDLGTEDLGGKGSKNPLKKLFDRLRMRNAKPRASADPFASSSAGLLTKLSGVGTLLLVLVALAGAVVPHIFYAQYRDFVVKKNEESKKELESTLAGLTKEISRLVPFQKELESYEAQKKLLRERLDLIQNLLSSRGTPVNVLDAVGQSLPVKAWLTSIDFDARPARPLITLVGQAITNDEVADYLDKLGESVYLNEVALDSLTFTKGSGTLSSSDVKSFQLSLFPKGLASATQRAIAKVPTPAPVSVPVAETGAAVEGGAAKDGGTVVKKTNLFKRRKQ